MGRKLGSPEWRLEVFMYEYVRPVPRRKKELVALAALIFGVEYKGCAKELADKIYALGHELRHRRASKYLPHRQVLWHPPDQHPWQFKA